MSYQTDIEENMEINWKIRDRIDTGRQTEWGLSIVRCTYSSQPRWEKYLSLIHGHIQVSVQHDLDARLRETLDCPIIEDKYRLDGATWKQARAKFDEWVVDGLKANPPDYTGYQPPPTEPSKRLRSDIYMSPRWEYFFYADQASVDSVVDCTADDPWMSKGDYWFTVVTTGLVQPRVFREDDDRVWIPDEESGDVWRGLYQKIKATDFVRLYAAIVADDFVGMIVGDDGISETW